MPHLELLSTELEQLDATKAAAVAAATELVLQDGWAAVSEQAKNKFIEVVLQRIANAANPARLCYFCCPPFVVVDAPQPCKGSLLYEVIDEFNLPRLEYAKKFLAAYWPSIQNPDVHRQYSIAELRALGEQLVDSYTPAMINHILQNFSAFTAQCFEILAANTKESIFQHPYFNRTLSFAERIAYITTQENYVISPKFGILNLGLIAGAIQGQSLSAQQTAQFTATLLENDLAVIAIFLELPFTMEQLFAIAAKRQMMKYQSRFYNSAAEESYPQFVGIYTVLRYQDFPLEDKIKLIKHLKSQVRIRDAAAMFLWNNRAVPLPHAGFIYISDLNLSAIDTITMLTRGLFDFKDRYEVYSNIKVALSSAKKTLELKDYISMMRGFQKICLADGKESSEFIDYFELDFDGAVDEFLAALIELNLYQPLLKRICNSNLISSGIQHAAQILQAIPLQDFYAVFRSENRLPSAHAIYGFINKLNENKTSQNNCVKSLLQALTFNQTQPQQETLRQGSPGIPAGAVIRNEGTFTLPRIANPLDFIMYFHAWSSQGIDIAAQINILKNIVTMQLDSAHPLTIILKAIPNSEFSNYEVNLKVVRYLQWWLYALINLASDARCIALIDEHMNWHLKFMLELAKLPDETLRYQLSNKYFAICESQVHLERFHELKEKQSFNASFVALLFADLKFYDPAQVVELKTKILAKINNVYNDGDAMRIMLSAILKVIEAKQLDTAQLISICAKILTPIPVVLSPHLIQGDKDQILNKAAQVATEGITTDPSALLIMPCKEQTAAGLQDNLAISYVHNGTRQLILSNQTAQYSTLSIKIHTALKRPNKAQKYCASLLPETGLLVPRLQHEVNLWLSIKSIAEEKSLDKIMGAINTRSLTEIFFQVALDNLGLTLTAEQAREFATNVMTQRENSGLFAYTSGLRKHCSKETCIPVLQKVLEAFATPQARDFYRMKYNVADNPHMALVLKRSDLFESWQSNYAISLASFDQQFSMSDIADKKIVPSEFLYDKVVNHKHLPKTMPFIRVYQFLRGPKSKQIGIFEEMECLTYEIVGDKLARYQFVHKLMCLYNTDKDDIAKQELLVTELLNFRLNTELENDLPFLRSYYKQLKSDAPIENFFNCDLVFTDHYWTALMLGTDVIGSCQRVYGSPQLNKCLLTFMVGPHVKILAILDANAKIMMRAIIRLCFDDKLQQPVLHLERIYAANACPQKLQQFIHMFAEYLAAEILHCTLVNSEVIDDNMQRYPNPVGVSHIPLGLTEYVDAVHGSHTRYNICNTWQMNSYARYKEQHKPQPLPLRVTSNFSAPSPI